MKNWSYTIKEGEHTGKTLWSGRYCAVAAFVFCKIFGTWCVLANKRGSGTPNYQGYWNCSCGFTNISSKFCPNCGQRNPLDIETWECGNCGTKNIKSKF